MSSFHARLYLEEMGLRVVAIPSPASKRPKSHQICIQSLQWLSLCSRRVPQNLSLHSPPPTHLAVSSSSPADQARGHPTLSSHPFLFTLLLPLPAELLPLTAATRCRYLQQLQHSLLLHTSFTHFLSIILLFC